MITHLFYDRENYESAGVDWHYSVIVKIKDKLARPVLGQSQ